MKTIKTIVFLIISLPSFLLSADNMITEEWLNAYLFGQKVGYGYTSTRGAEYNGMKCYEETSETKIKINRGGVEFETTSYSRAYVSKNFVPLYFKSSEKMSNVEKVVEGKIDKGKLKLKIISGNDITEKEMDFPKEVYLDDSISDVIKFKGIKQGKKYNLNVFLKQALTIIEVDVSIEGREKVWVKDKEFEGTKINSSMLGINTSTIVDDDYKIIKSEYKDINMVLERTTKEEALDIVDVSKKEDILEIASITSNIKLNGENVKKLRIRIEHPEFDKIRKNLIEEDRQDFAPNGILEINSNVFEFKDALSLPIQSIEYVKYMEPTFYEQSNNEEIINKAKEIAADEKNSYIIAKKIMQWVNKNVAKKNFNVGFASAKETLDSKEGDCTEHSVLMSAMLKAIGIPTKVVGGVVYFNERFYYHMWVRVFVGKWVDMDPTLNQSPVDATHIKFAEGILNEEGLVNICIGVLPTLKSMKIEIIDWAKN